MAGKMDFVLAHQNLDELHVSDSILPSKIFTRMLSLASVDDGALQQEFQVIGS